MQGRTYYSCVWCSSHRIVPLTVSSQGERFHFLLLHLKNSFFRYLTICHKHTTSASAHIPQLLAHCAGTTYYLLYRWLCPQFPSWDTVPVVPDSCLKGELKYYPFSLVLWSLPACLAGNGHTVLVVCANIIAHVLLSLVILGSCRSIYLLINQWCVL